MFTVSVVPTICLTPHTVVSMECGVILNYHSTHHATVEKSVPWSILVSLDHDYLKKTTSLNVANDICNHIHMQGYIHIDDNIDKNY